MENEAKKAIRRRIAEVIKSLPREERARRSAVTCEHLLAVPEIQAAHAVLFYVPLPDELDVWPVLHAFADAKKRIILPKCQPAKHEVICIEVGDFKTDLVRGTFNILEPARGIGVGIGDLDVVVAPGRAFDLDGNRIGRGAGYYDRFFVREGFRALVCGICFDCQVFPSLPTEPHDVPVGALVTESGLRRFRHSAAVAANK